MKRLVWDSDVKNIRDEKIRGLRPDIKDEWDLIDAVPTADLGELWTPVDRGLPEEGVRVLVRLDGDKPPIGEPRMDTDRVVDGRWVRWFDLVTHWMPLPNKPKED